MDVLEVSFLFGIAIIMSEIIRVNEFWEYLKILDINENCSKEEQIIISKIREKLGKIIIVLGKPYYKEYEELCDIEEKLMLNWKLTKEDIESLKKIARILIKTDHLEIEYKLYNLIFKKRTFSRK
ncbi:MAG: hypothetical protein ACLR60_11900 [Clostridium paraputrificum]